MKWIIAIALLIVAFSCADQNSNKSNLGQYVYIDPFCKIHIDRDCASSGNEQLKTKDERMLASRGVVFFDTCQLTPYGHNVYGVLEKYRFCPKCIDDNTYRHLSEIMERNQ